MMFHPPLNSQRHQFVIDFVKKNKPQRVVDLGCSDCTLLKKLKFHRDTKLLVGVDINAAKLKKKMHGLAPLSADYLQPSFDQLRIELYHGSVTQKDARLRGFDLVTSLELIEHLSLASVERFSEVVFGYMTPATVIISTPNSEFNPLFPGLTGFRHREHKFEWTRAEFQSWAQKVCQDYGYEVEFTGVGLAPHGKPNGFGFCSQIGVFHHLGGRDACNTLFDDDDMFSYTLLYSVNYPSLRDNNILRRFLVNEVLFWAEELKRRYLEKMTVVRDDGLLQTDGGAKECLRTSTQNLVMEEGARSTEMENPLEQCGQGVPEGQVFWANSQGQQVSPRQNRCVSVPLVVLWSISPKVSTMSGSLSNLQHFLMEDPHVELSQDGSAVLLQEKDHDEEGYIDLEDSGYTDASEPSHGAQKEEDWEPNI